VAKTTRLMRRHLLSRYPPQHALFPGKYSSGGNARLARITKASDAYPTSSNLFMQAKHGHYTAENAIFTYFSDGYAQLKPTTGISFKSKSYHNRVRQPFHQLNLRIHTTTFRYISHM
jgi:hypothetical protein